MPIKGGIAREPSSQWQAPINCFNKRGANGALTGDTGYNTEDDGVLACMAGLMWTSTARVSAAFHTVLPPNAPTCIDSPDGIWNMWGYLGTASSYHPGGASACFADGSGRFVNESISTTSQSTNTGLQTWARWIVDRGMGAPSPYGVWGALGTRAGNETASL